jgi:hypothetical protein
VVPFRYNLEREHDMTATTANLLDHLQEQGYEPQDPASYHGQRVEYYDLVVSGVGTVRVCIYPDDGHSAEVRTFAFDSYMCEEWEARFTPGTPDAAIIAVIEAAEDARAAKRGGPVTPAQEEAAR